MNEGYFDFSIERRYEEEEEMVVFVRGINLEEMYPGFTPRNLNQVLGMFQTIQGRCGNLEVIIETTGKPVEQIYHNEGVVFC